MEFKHINIEELKKNYQSGMSLRQLAKLYDTTSLTIKHKLIKANIAISGQNEYLVHHRAKHREMSFPGSALTPELLIQLWGKKSISAISRETGATDRRIKKMARRLKLLDLKPQAHKLIEFWWDSFEWLQKHYIELGLSLNDLSVMTGSQYSTIRKKIEDYGIKLRSQTEAVHVRNTKPETSLKRSIAARKTFPKIRERIEAGRDKYLASLPKVPFKDRDWLYNEYLNKNATQIAREQNVHPITIKYWLCKFELYDETKLRRWTDEMRELARSGSLSLWQSEADRLRIRTDIQKRLISDQLKSYFKDPANQAKLQAWKTKLSIGARKLWQDEEYIRKAKASTKRGRLIDYRPLKSDRELITLRSHLECAFAISLDLDEGVAFWQYETTRLKYEIDGKEHTYIIDFTYYGLDRKAQQLEVKPIKLQIFEPKYKTAAESFTAWRFTSPSEINLASCLFKEGFRTEAITFRNHWPKSGSYIAWSKEQVIEVPAGWSVQQTNRFGVYFKHRCLRNEELPLQIT